MISSLYAAVMRRRREFYAARPDLRRRLRKPVISVGNIAVGGRGKTPTVAFLAKLLVERGERPAILSRGYARRVADDGVVVVRDRERILVDLARAGDESLMLARQLDGVPVLVAVDRHLAGVLAERRSTPACTCSTTGSSVQLERMWTCCWCLEDSRRQPCRLRALVGTAGRHARPTRARG
jgi:tetraacyldisaccharide 4'-kinase